MPIHLKKGWHFNEKKMSSHPIIVTIFKESQGYRAEAELEGAHVFAVGESLPELKSEAWEALCLADEELAEEGKLSKNDLQWVFDIHSFFDFFKVVNAKALSRRIGMNPSLLAQYISGAKKPSERQLRRIAEGIRELGKELSGIELS